MYQGSLAIAGECMCTRPFSMHEEPEFLDLIKILRGADTTYCHMEMNIFEKGSSYPGRPVAPSALQADPIIADELKWAGIDLVSSAYNHTLDWGLPGVLGTNDNLDRVGIVHAGTGNNLEEAREPAYFESKAGRVAIISMSSGHHPYDSAGAVKSPVRGRPGVNPLRVTQKYVITPEKLTKLQEIWSELGLSITRPFTVAAEEGDNFLVAGDFGGGNAATMIFRIGDKAEVQSFLNKWDLEANLRAIRDARRQADLVIVAHHAAVNEGKRGYTPCKFVPPLAKECIEAGADVFVGHGWHRQLGIELYRGKPIFYGTGNFFAQSQFLQRFPADVYEAFGFNLDDLAKLSPSDLHENREKHMPHWAEEPGGVITTLDIEDGKVKGLTLYPYSMGYDFGTGGKTGQVRKAGARMDGRPVLTYGEDAKTIIDYVTKLSAQYNTCIEYQDGIGVIAIK
jgi:poly-gamma-glutamate capsule biosynthesis protein CapA/YwtB (metallophosphatase superfamily)